MELRRRKIRWALIAAIFALAVVCAKSSVRATPDDANPLKSYVGKIYLLRGEGDHAAIHVSRSGAGNYRGQCDVALEITHAEFAKSEVEFDGVIVGAAQLAGHNTNTCPNFPAATKIFIAGFTPRDGQQEVAEAVGKILMQPDAYLASYNVTIAIAPSGSEDMLSPLAPPGTAGLMPPKPILSVNASYTDSARRARLNGSVTVQTTVGRDGHLYSGTILNSLDPTLDERVLLLLPLWRLQPAKIEGEPVAFQVSLATTFNLY